MEDIDKSILDFYIREYELLKEKVKLLEKQLQQLLLEKKNEARTIESH